MFRSIADNVLAFLESVLTFLHNLVEPVFGVHSWGWSIVMLTLVVRVLLLPLAIKQTRSMRGMQAIQPKIKEIQARHKVDRELMRKDPDRYRAKKQKMNEEMMALYQEEGVNPAASCLPLLAQAPVFIALFWAIRGMDELQDAPFYFFTNYITAGPGEPAGLGALVSQASWPGWLLIVLMSGTMFITQKQMMARTAATGADNPMAQQQKILLYVMPAFLAVISFQFMLGLLLYWVTTNLWQVLQQWIILREVSAETPSEGTKPSNRPGKPGTGGASSGRSKPTTPPSDRPDPGAGRPPSGGSGDGGNGTEGGGEPKAPGPKGSGPKGSGPKGRTPPSSGGSKKGPSQRDHLPKRGKRD